MKNIKKRLGKVLAIGVLAFSLGGCFWGEKVEVPPAHVGKVMGKNGYKEGVITTSKFRLDKCWTYCDKLITMDVSDSSYTERMELFMPKDKLKMSFDIRLTLTPNPAQYDSLFDRIPAINQQIPLGKIYTTYAQQLVRSKARELLAEYTIAEIASSREGINTILANELRKELQQTTPFLVRYIGLADVAYPEIITKAQELAAERRERIEQENAQLEISKVQLERKLQEQQLQRKIDVEKAEAEAEVNRIMASTVTPEYLQYHNIQIMYEMAKSDNKMIIPSNMVDSIATQVAVGNQIR
ncbi:stomatin-like protein [Alteromonas phage vB_AmeM_PT11-V22]|uniref:Stomatin-like protein n=1 Tax=Alteromonas phage vB_AmeM_PT11-V22 TaxID=2704031 RepID=A0A6C0R307_9CAUD|nr:stomatin-like protein [Alteromonas phage vB_AmeM_PT11-V22]QHZ59802.1 stomatin-like protein [Alteromonas phage vB_AmeM_PT11-V22]